MNELIKVKDESNKIYTMYNSSKTTGQDIISVYYSTSYIQFQVQDTITLESGELSYPVKDIFVIFNNANPVDLLGVTGEIGEIVEVSNNYDRMSDF